MKPKKYHNQNGDVMVEYLIVTVVVTLVMVGAFMAIGVPMLQQYRYSTGMLMLPFP